MASNDQLGLASDKSADVRDDTPASSNVGMFKSIIWEHFNRIDVNKERKAICKLCKMKLVAQPKDGTRHLDDHMNKSCIM